MPKKSDLTTAEITALLTAINAMLAISERSINLAYLYGMTREQLTALESAKKNLEK